MSELQMPTLEIQLTRTRPGSLNANAVVKLDGRVLHRDQITPGKASDRNRFAAEARSAIGEHTGIEQTQIDRELMEATNRLMQPDPDGPNGTEFGPHDELPVQNILRPELIITEHVSAVTIPRLAQRNGRPTREWAMFRIVNGKRECVPLSERIEVPGGSEYWIDPLPPPPTTGDVRRLRGWSLQGRQDWLDGAPTPTTAEVLRMVCERIDRYIVLPAPHAAEHCLTLGAWTMMTYLYPALLAIPYLSLSGPAGSGKTKTMDVLARMVFRPFMTASLTGPTLYRTRHTYGGVFLLDEVERMQDSRSPEISALLQILNAGYKADGEAMRMESQGDSFASAAYQCYGPIVLGAIKGLPAALASRCITVRMLRAAKEDPQSRRSIDDSPEEESRVRDALHAWALERGYQIANRSLEKSKLANRDAEIWSPLLQIVADTEQQDTYAMLLSHAENLAASMSEDTKPEADPVLLTALLEVVSNGRFPTASEVLTYARSLEPDAIGTKYTARGVSAILKRYGFSTQRSNGRNVYKSDASAISSAMSRYDYALEVSE